MRPVCGLGPPNRSPFVLDLISPKNIMLQVHVSRYPGNAVSFCNAQSTSMFVSGLQVYLTTLFSGQQGLHVLYHAYKLFEHEGNGKCVEFILA